MIEELITQRTYFFIRYPVGGAGAHLHNLIKLCPLMDHNIPEYSKQQYQDFVEQVYNNYSQKNAHLPSYHHIISEKDLWEKSLSRIDHEYPFSIYTGHAASFDWAESIISHLENKKFISMTFNSNRSIEILRRRERQLFGTDTLANEYYQKELAHFYNRWFDSEIPDDVNLDIEVEEMFLENIKPTLEKISTKYKLDFPLDFAQYLHNLWINKQDLS